MSNPNLEPKVRELLELKRMKEELEQEITAAEDEIKSIMGDEETLFAGAYMDAVHIFPFRQHPLQKGSC